MRCPVCKTECHEKTVCPVCGFAQFRSEFINHDELQQWITQAVDPFRKLYWRQFPDFVIKGTTLVEYKGHENKVLVPKGVTKISETAFKGGYFDMGAIKKIVLPDGLDTIAPQAFTFCHNLLELNIPSTVKIIGYSILPSRQKCIVDCQTLVNPFEIESSWTCFFPGDYYLEKYPEEKYLYQIKDHALITWQNRWFYADGTEMPERYYPQYKWPLDIDMDYDKPAVELTLASSYWPDEGDIEFDFIAENHTSEEQTLRVCITMGQPLPMGLHWTGDYEDYIFLKPNEISFDKIRIAPGEMKMTIRNGEPVHPYPAVLDIFLDASDDSYDFDECIIELDVIRGAWEE